MGATCNICSNHDERNDFNPYFKNNLQINDLHLSPKVAKNINNFSSFDSDDKIKLYSAYFNVRKIQRKWRSYYQIKKRKQFFNISNIADKEYSDYEKRDSKYDNKEDKQEDNYFYVQNNHEKTTRTIKLNLSKISEDQVCEESKEESFFCFKNFDNGFYKGYLFKKSQKYQGPSILKLNDLTFFGSFTHGEASGYGLIVSKGKYCFEGEFKKGLEQGYGIEISENHNIYIGEYSNGKKHGIGMNFFNDGNKYEGEFSEGIAHGYGVYYYLDGRIYKGNFFDNKMKGYGELYLGEGKSFVGEFNSSKEGWGVYILNEKIFVGFYSGGKKNGIGKYIEKGKSKIGLFSKGSLLKWLNTEKESHAAIGASQSPYIKLFSLSYEELLQTFTVHK